MLIRPGRPEEDWKSSGFLGFFIFGKGGVVMKKVVRILLIGIVLTFIFPYTGISADSDPDIKQLYRQIETLKKRIDQLEKIIEQREAKEEEMRKEIKEVKETKGEIEHIKERLGTLSIHGGVVTYYQAGSSADIKTENGWQHFANPDSAGYVADIELGFEPTKNGSFYLRIHAGEGNGADEGLEDAGALFADLNTINDDNPSDSEIDVLEAYYTQNLLNDTLSISIGKTEPFVFVDDNEFANDENSQFVGKPFVNNPMFDSEDEYGPILAINYTPEFILHKKLTLTTLIQSSSWPRNNPNQQKDQWSNFFRRPLIAAQIKYSPTIKGKDGNYRLYGWIQTYKHDRIGNKTGTDEGWGIGLSCDQYITEKIGLFGRFGYQNDEVYEAPVFYSIGASLKGIIPSRQNDEIGIAFAGLKANHAFDEHDTEFHTEGYYRFYITDNFALTCDLQYIANPRGNTSNDDIWAGMIRGEFGF